MAATSIVRQNNVVNVAFAGNTSSQLAIPGGTQVTYRFINGGTVLSLMVFNDEYQIPFSQLSIAGSPPANVTAAYSALATVFSPS